MAPQRESFPFQNWATATSRDALHQLKYLSSRSIPAFSNSLRFLIRFIPSSRTTIVGLLRMQGIADEAPLYASEWLTVAVVVTEEVPMRAQIHTRGRFVGGLER